MGDLDKLIVAKGFKKLPKVHSIAQSGHKYFEDLYYYNRIPAQKRSFRENSLINRSPRVKTLRLEKSLTRDTCILELHHVLCQSSGLVGEDVFDLAQLLQCSKMFFSKTETWSQLRTRRVLMWSQCLKSSHSSLCSECSFVNFNLRYIMNIRLSDIQAHLLPKTV